MSKIWYLSGKALFNDLRKPDKKYDKYGISVILDQESAAKYKTIGLNLKPKKDRDGHDYYTFSRKRIGKRRGQDVDVGPPEVIDPNGKPIVQAVGLGSEVTIKVEVYDTANGPGHRLEAVRVDELVKGREVDDVEDPF